MFQFLSALFLWLTMITVLLSESLDRSALDFEFNKSVLDEDPQEIYNKTLASKSSTKLDNSNTRTSLMPPAMYFPTTSIPMYSSSESANAAPLVPNRGSFFTPAIPKHQFSYPFEDKSTLRGSNSANTVFNRRAHVQGPPEIAGRNTFNERIPIKRPDLMAAAADTKKTINTASIERLPEAALNYAQVNDSASVSTSVHGVNNTLDLVVPAVHNMSYNNILRILHNGKNKNDFIESSKPRVDQELKTFKTYYSVPTSKPSPSPSPSTVMVRSLYEEDKQQLEIIVTQVTSAKSSYIPSKAVQDSELTEDSRMSRQPHRVRYILGLAWDIHVYLIAILFAVLACMSAYSLARMKTCKWMLPRGYFFAVHSLLTIIGAVRSIYFFYDAYNIGGSFVEPVSRLLLNVPFPLLVCIFALMFVFVLKIIDLNTDFHYADKTNLFLSLVIVYTFLSTCLDLYADLTTYSSMLILFSQFLFIFMCIIFGTTYMVFHKYFSHSSVYSSTFSDIFKPCLAHTMRVMLATSLLSLLMAAIQLIGIFCVYDPLNRMQPYPWLWWAFQLSIRVIEVSICFLIFWAAAQRLQDEDEKEIQSHSASGFPLFACNSPKGSDHSKEEDIYSSICNVNQPSLCNGNQVYEDVFQCCHTSPPLPPLPPPPPPPMMPVLPVRPELLSHTTHRGSLRRHQMRVHIDPMRSAGGTLNRYPQRRHPETVVDAQFHAEGSRLGLGLSPASGNYNSTNGLYNSYRPFL